MVFIFLALWTVPIVQAIFVASFGLPGDLYLLKDLARICIANNVEVAEIVSVHLLERAEAMKLS